ncbi:hypothetical protein M8J77_010275 [Diaphorina citri]|nr:hypothetical protein M8J77_010275 [Diaphorina citri]
MISSIPIIVTSALFLLVTECRGITPDDCSTQTLVLVQAIFRHGNRTRDHSEGYEKDAYDKEEDWLPLGFDQLTSTGRNTEYSLGQFLRSRYDGFLSRTYFYKDITVVSSNAHRTRESAQLVSAGLYSPPVGHNRWGEGNGLGHYWQPIPVDNMPKDDLWLQTKASCPPYDKEYDYVLNHQFASFNEKNKDLYTYLSKHTGENITTVREVSKIFNTLKIDEENNKRLPDWATPRILQKSGEFRLLGCQVRTHTDFMKTIKGGPMMHLLSVNLYNKTHNCLSPDNKMILYSAHDTTIIHVLNTLGATKMSDPQYGACILVELHKVKGQYVVRVLYLESGLDHTVEPITFHSWQSNAPIPLDTFKEMLDKYLVKEKDWYEKCHREYCS